MGAKQLMCSGGNVYESENKRRIGRWLCAVRRVLRCRKPDLSAADRRCLRICLAVRHRRIDAVRNHAPLATIIAVDNMGGGFERLCRPVSSWFCSAYMVFFVIFILTCGIPRQGGVGIETGVFSVLPSLQNSRAALIIGLLCYYGWCCSSPPESPPSSTSSANI